jgi:DNA-binding PucR family transcriptional regulator
MGERTRAVVAFSGPSVLRLSRLFRAAVVKLQNPARFARSPVYTLRADDWEDVLLEVGGSEPLLAFRDAWLARLLQHDERHRGQLVATLAAYLNSRCSPTEAAALLHVHRNTLLYRLRKIADVTGRDPDDSAVRFGFQCAMTIDRAFRRG